MKRFLTFCLSFLGSVAFAQGVLEIKDISQPNDVFSSINDDAAVIFRCHQSIPLTFSSTMDKTVEPFKSELQGTDSIYYIAFPTGKNYRGREVTIIASGYSPLFLNLELQPKQLLSYQVTDPNATVDAGCYREHRNKGVAELKNMNYDEARNQFVLARECSDVNKEENEKNIQNIDSIFYCRKKADDLYTLYEYSEASKYYQIILNLNPYDTYASNRNGLCVNNFIDECTTLFTKAEFYYSEKEFDKAKDLYQKIVDRECKSSAIAIQRLNSISTNQKAKKDHARVFSYEYRKDVPIGFSYGKYNMHKVGGFFAMDFNSKVFDAIRNDCKYGDKDFAEVNMSFGWTVKAYNPIWIHFGPGFTGKMYHGTYAKDQYPIVGYGEDELLDNTKDIDEDDMKKANAAIAISPVIGVTAKYSYFALRLTYQYRWSIQSKLQDFMGRSRLSIGVGIAF